jgi:hypothetical protein
MLIAGFVGAESFRRSNGRFKRPVLVEIHDLAISCGVLGDVGLLPKVAGLELTRGRVVSHGVDFSLVICLGQSISAVVGRTGEEDSHTQINKSHGLTPLHGGLAGARASMNDVEATGGVRDIETSELRTIQWNSLQKLRIGLLNSGKMLGTAVVAVQVDKRSGAGQLVEPVLRETSRPAS